LSPKCFDVEIRFGADSYLLNGSAPEISVFDVIWIC
jgi:hypothetical protein